MFNIAEKQNKVCHLDVYVRFPLIGVGCHTFSRRVGCGQHICFVVSNFDKFTVICL